MFRGTIIYQHKTLKRLFYLGDLYLDLGVGKKDTLFIKSMNWTLRYNIKQRKQLEGDGPFDLNYRPQDFITINQIAEVYGKRFRKSSLKRLYDYFNSKKVWVHIKEHEFKI
jgi:hypothetical protein